MAGAVAAEPLPRPCGLFSRYARAQYAALAWLQYRILMNSLRTRRGGFELSARILTWILFGLVAFGPAVGMGFGAWLLTARGQIQGVAGLLWVLCLVWQSFSALAPALAGQNPELGQLLRYPVSFGSWVLLYLVHGLAAPSTLIGSLWATAIALGIGIARPGYFLWAALTLAVFVLFNLLLARMVLSWIERWMAQRRTRELLTAVFLFAALGAQTLNPAFHQSQRGFPFGIRRTAAAHLMSGLWRIQKALPPGLAYESIAKDQTQRPLAAAESLTGLVIYALTAAAFLGIRLRAESRGESLSETPRASISPAAAATRPRRFLDFSGPVAAVIEKDLRYLLRSGPMLYNLAAPLVMVFLFGGTMGAGRFSSLRIQYALPFGMIWAFMGLTRLVSNNLGTEGQGIQLYFLSPVSLRTVILGKNLLHLIIFALETALITAVVIVRWGAPAPAIAAATFAWLLFAAPANLAVGNALSITMPYRVNMVRMRQEQGAAANALLSMLAQFLILTVGAAVLVPCAAFGHPWLATPLLLLLAIPGGAAYAIVLRRVSRMMYARMESLTRNLVRSTSAG